MNLKLNGSAAGSSTLLRKPAESVKEERRRTGRYIAILVGICLLILAMYHAWVRRIPVVASLVVPALIMFVYVGWVLYTASRDKHKLMLLDAEAALAASHETTERDIPVTEQNNLDIISKDKNTPDSPKHWPELSSLLKGDPVPSNLTKPIILINDRLPEDQDLRWTQIVELVTSNDKLKGQTRRKFKRKFCRSKRHAHFKRSYSIA